MGFPNGNRQPKKVIPQVERNRWKNKPKSSVFQVKENKQKNIETKKISDVFQDVDGVSLLKPEYKRVISDVVEETVRKIEENKNDAVPVEGVEVDLCEKVEVLKKNIDTIVRVMKLKNEFKRQFIEKSPEWMERNNETVSTLNGIKDILKKHRKNCNISRVVGYGTSLIGGGLCVASAALAPLTMGLTLPFAIAGGSMIGTGTTTAMGTSITEAVLLNKQVKKTKTILNGNKSLGEELNEFLCHSCQLSEAIENVMKMKFFKDMINEVADIVVKAAKIRKCEVREMLISWIVIPIISLLPVGAACCLNVTATLISLVIAFIFLRHSTKFVADCGILASKAAILALTFTNSVIDMGVAVANIVAANVARKVGVAVARGSFAIISMVLDITNIILHGIEMKNGSVSKDAKRIGDLAQLLQEQGEVVKQVREILIKEDQQIPDQQIPQKNQEDNKILKKSKIPRFMNLYQKKASPAENVVSVC